MNSVCGWLTHLELGKERWILESAGWQWELRVWREGEIVEREKKGVGTECILGVC